MTCAQNGQSSWEIDSGSEFNRLSGEINQRITKEMSDFISSGNFQIQRAIKEAISGQILPQIRASLKSGQGRLPKRRWEYSARTPKNRSEEALDRIFRSDPRDDCHRLQNGKDDLESTHDMVIGDNESPSTIPNLSPKQSHPDRHSINNDPLDTTLPATEQTPLVAVQNQINRLADVLTNLKNRRTAQQLTIHPVNSNTMTLDCKNEKFELFEDFFRTMIKMQPERSEQLKTNHFHSLFRKGALQTFRNFSTANRQTLEDVLVIFRRKYDKPESLKRLPYINGIACCLILTRRSYQASSKD